MKITRTGSAIWQGGLKDGHGTISTESGALDGRPYGFAMRFEGVKGTNPEELIGGAHAGCFSQFLALLLSENDTPPRSIATTARVAIEVTDGGPTITRIDLSTTVDVDLSTDQIEEFAQKAKVGCPVSKALTGIETITLEVAKA